jgi:hypothetical protein
VTSFTLSPEQIERLLSTERLDTYVAEYLQEDDTESFGDHRQEILAKHSSDALEEAANYAYEWGAQEIETYTDPLSAEYKILVTECEQIYAVWSDDTDWVGSFKSKQDAVDFVQQNLLA